MPLSTGTRLGPYEIIAALGAGGMGEVYRARDVRLGRVVAIKILRSTVAADPERLGRFEREARTLASLNHPNIATLYGVEETNGVTALVMEVVEGETLAERIVGPSRAGHFVPNLPHGGAGPIRPTDRRPGRVCGRSRSEAMRRVRSARMARG
jgi:serine/threonine protein kinase